MAIPKGEFFKDKVGRDGTARSFPKAQHGFTIIAKIEPDARRLSAPMGRRSKKRSPVRNSWCLYNAFLLSVPKSGFCFLWGKCRVR